MEDFHSQLGGLETARDQHKPPARACRRRCTVLAVMLAVAAVGGVLAWAAIEGPAAWGKLARALADPVIMLPAVGGVLPFLLMGKRKMGADGCAAASCAGSRRLQMVTLVLGAATLLGLTALFVSMR